MTLYLYYTLLIIVLPCATLVFGDKPGRLKMVSYTRTYQPALPDEQVLALDTRTSVTCAVRCVTPSSHICHVYQYLQNINRQHNKAAKESLYIYIECKLWHKFRLFVSKHKTNSIVEIKQGDVLRRKKICNRKFNLIRDKQQPFDLDFYFEQSKIEVYINSQIVTQYHLSDVIISVEEVDVRGHISLTSVKVEYRI